MGHPLDEAGLDTIFRTARSYNGYLDKPVGEDQLRAALQRLVLRERSLGSGELDRARSVQNELFRRVSSHRKPPETSKAPT